MIDQINELIDAGLVLIEIPAKDGAPTKGPILTGWNEPYCKETNINGYGKPFVLGENFNYGLLHSASNTIALDLDDVLICRELFKDTCGLSLDAMLTDPKRLEIKSPKTNRGKLIFKLPDNIALDTIRKLVRPSPGNSKNKETIFELRGGPNQDVIIGNHPEGGEYKIIGNPFDIPMCPDVFLNMAMYWESWKPVFDSFLNPGVYKKDADIDKDKESNKLIVGQRDAVAEFNEQHNIRDILARNGYKPMGNRYIRPNSESGAPGIVFYNDYPDGVERIYSHGGDDLADGHAHYAFNCYKILECDGDFKTASKWSEAINAHNKKVYLASKAETIADKEDEEEGLTWSCGDSLADNAKAPEFLINNILETDSHGMLAGDSMAFKTFVDLRMAYSICTGVDFMGYQVFKTGKVMYVCGEGKGALARRIKALKIAESDFNGNLLVLDNSIEIDKHAHMNLLKREVDAYKPALVIFDTFGSLVGNSDENSASDVGIALRLIKETCRNGFTSSMIVHHYGKDSARGMRGSIAFKANSDFEMSLERDKDTETMITTLSSLKMKDGENFKPITMKAEIIELDLTRQDGKESTSLVVKNADVPGFIKKDIGAEKAGHVLKFLESVILDGGQQYYSNNRGVVNAIKLKDFQARMYGIMEGEKDAKRKSLSRSLDLLIKNAKVIKEDGYLWIFNV